MHYPVHVRFSDVDVYGHVNNVKYFEYFQEARISVHRATLGTGLDADSTLVVAQTDVDYRVPILFRPEPYDVWSWVPASASRSATIESRDPRRRHRLLAGPGDDRLLRPGDPALAPSRRTAYLDACWPSTLSAHSNVLTMNCAAWVT